MPSISPDSKKSCLTEFDITMNAYSDSEKNDDLATLGIDERSELNSDLVTGKYKKLARIYHPDKKGGTKEAFQKLKNAFDRLTAFLDDKNHNQSDVEYEKEFFKTSNFPLEKKNCFVVLLENNLSNQWEYCFKELYGKEKLLETGGIQFKVDGMTLSFYNKPKKDNKTKVLIQGKDKDNIFDYVFETMPKVYKTVLERCKKELPND